MTIKERRERIAEIERKLDEIGTAITMEKAMLNHEWVKLNREIYEAEYGADY